MLRNIVTSTLGLSDAQTSWHREGNRPHVLFFPAPRPPARITWSDVEGHVRTAKATAPLLGLDRNRQPVFADLEADSPHILISAGSGGGKSALTKVLLAQALRNGSRAIILDFKRISHAWAKGLPGVTYCKDVADIHEALVRAGAEGDRRNLAADDGAPVGERIFVVAEEMNATITKLGQFWDATREKDDPKRSPAISGLGDVLFMGRQVSMHVIAIAQMMTARTLGGPEARENFATRCLTRYTLNAWRMLAPEVWPAPKRSRIVGRWQIVKGGEATEVQVPWLTDDEAREWASGAPEPALAAVPAPAGPSDLADTAGTVPGGTPDDLLTLRDARTELELAMTLEALRKAAQREGFPAPARTTSSGHLYRRADLVTWYRRREGVRAVSTTSTTREAS